MRIRAGGKRTRTYSSTPTTRTRTTTKTPTGRQVVDTIAPGQEISTQQQQPQMDVNIGGSSNSSGTLIALVLLYLIVFWKDYFAPLLDSIWNKKPFKPTTNGYIIIGGAVFILILMMIAESSEGGKDLAIVITFGMWLVFVMFNGSSVFSGLISLMTNPSFATTTTPATQTQTTPTQKTV